LSRSLELAGTKVPTETDYGLYGDFALSGCGWIIYGRDGTAILISDESK